MHADDPIFTPPFLSTSLLYLYIKSIAEQYMSIEYHLVQSLGKGVYRQQRYKVLSVVIALDDFDCIRDLSDSLDVLCGRLDLLNTLAWSRYLPRRKSGSKGDSIVSPSNAGWRKDRNARPGAGDILSCLNHVAALWYM